MSRRQSKAVDDLLATGAISGAAVSLVKHLGGDIRETVFLVELKFLDSRKHLKGFPVRSIVEY